MISMLKEKEEEFMLWMLMRLKSPLFSTLASNSRDRRRGNVLVRSAVDDVTVQRQVVAGGGVAGAVAATTRGLVDEQADHVSGAGAWCGKLTCLKLGELKLIST